MYAFKAFGCQKEWICQIPVLSESAISPWSSIWPGCLFLPGGGRGRSGTTVPAACLRRERRLRRSGSVVPITVVSPRAVGPLALALPTPIPPTGGCIPRIWVIQSWGRRVVGVYHMPWHARLPAEIGDVDLGLSRRIDPHRSLERRVYPHSSATMQTAKLHGGCVLGSETQLVTTQHCWLGHLTFSSSSTDVLKRGCGHVKCLTWHAISTPS